ncbi:hypothetical protein B0H63DRAFT_447629 [Podospora didyma]|uniref:Uncharacterized protein n=1 Tax=Podospora didyma TaxID=330526 RepID=A0AAE0NSI4_9PEZI|nr:hypothetical protein B0H63DRAFT_447629 [Podospora didyma]
MAAALTVLAKTAPQGTIEQKNRLFFILLCIKELDLPLATQISTEQHFSDLESSLNQLPDLDAWPGRVHASFLGSKARKRSRHPDVHKLRDTYQLPAADGDTALLVTVMYLQRQTERLDRPWELIKGVDRHEYCWRRPPPKFSERETLQYANAAWVLEKDDDIKVFRAYGCTCRGFDEFQDILGHWQQDPRIQDSDKLGIKLITGLEDPRDKTRLVKGWEQYKEKLLRFSV